MPNARWIFVVVLLNSGPALGGVGPQEASFGESLFIGACCLFTPCMLTIFMVWLVIAGLIFGGRQPPKPRNPEQPS